MGNDTITTGSKKLFARGRGAQLALVATLALGLAACSPVFRNHGYVPTEQSLSALRVDVDTRATVLETLGSPTAEGIMTENAFYYVQSRFEHFGPVAPKEIDRQVLVLTFSGDKLRNVERFGLERGQVVTLSRRVTEERLKDTTLLRQLMGNIGNFDAASMIGQDSQ